LRASISCCSVPKKQKQLFNLAIQSSGDTIEASTGFKDAAILAVGMQLPQVLQRHHQPAPRFLGSSGARPCMPQRNPHARIIHA
jgi:hypothetical protein